MSHHSHIGGSAVHGHVGYVPDSRVAGFRGRPRLPAVSLNLDGTGRHAHVWTSFFSFHGMAQVGKLLYLPATVQHYRD